MKKINLINHFLNFVAVILGVLLAFYVNSCSETNKEKKELKEIVTSLMADLENDHKTYSEYQIPVNETQSKELENLIADILNVENKAQESLSVSVEVENYSPISSTYLSINSSGKINLIDDLEVKKKLSNYYDILSEESIKKGDLQVNFFLNEILPWMMENTDLLDMQADDFIGQKKLVNRLILYRTLIENKKSQYIEIDEASIELQKVLSKFIKK